jgi:phosphocarrier protein
MIIKQLKIQNELGFHARVASRIVRETKQFNSSITVKKEGKDFNLKNVTGVITVNAKNGDILSVVFDGDDEADAAEAIETLFLKKFGEK